MKVLPSCHNSPETAYVIEDYPFGSGLRCFKRIWIESPSKGAKSKCQRVVWQTTKKFFNQDYTSCMEMDTDYETSNRRSVGDSCNIQAKPPMQDAHLWNKEKKGVYGAMQILFVEEETGHIKIDGLGEYPWEEHCKKFIDTYGSGLDEQQLIRLKHLHSGLVAARIRHDERQKAIRDAT